MDKYILTSLIIITYILVLMVYVLRYVSFLQERKFDKKKMSEDEIRDGRDTIYKNIKWTYFFITLVFFGVWVFS